MLATREIEQEHKAELSPFEIIYQAAIDRDKKTITSVLSVACVDVQNSADGTAASKLAFEGRDEAVHFLRTQFHASLSWIAFGYARGGHVDEVNEVFKLAPPARQRVVLKQMVSGYALGGYVDEAKEVLKLAETPADRLVLLGCMAHGYARGGHVDEAQEVLKLAETPADRLVLLGSMAYGYARGGHVDEAQEVFKLAPPARQRVVLKQMVSGYALGGHVDEAKEVLKLAATSDDQFVLLDQMVESYGLVGNKDAADEVLKLAESPTDRQSLLEQTVYNYARGGHVGVFNKVVEREDKGNNHFGNRNIAYHCASGGHVSAAHGTLKLATTSEDRFTFLSDMAYGYVRHGYVEEANDVLKHAETDANLRALSKIIVNELNKISFSTEYASLRTLASFSSDFQPLIASESKDFREVLTPLVPRAKEIRVVMRSEKLNFNQAMGWTQPEMQIWLLQGVQLVQKKKLTAEMFLSICKYLTLGSAPEMTHLSNKLCLAVCPDRFFKNLAGYNHLLTVAPPKNPSAVLDAKNPKRAFGR